MAGGELSGRLAHVATDGDLPRHEDLGTVFDELGHQMACQAYLWALPLVSYAQWKTQHYEVFGATSSDLVTYVSRCCSARSAATRSPGCAPTSLPD